MDEAEINKRENSPASGQDGPRDGLMSFSDYSDTQLNDLKYTIDQPRFPENYRNLLAELARRTKPSDDPASLTNVFFGRFSRNDGLRGWLQAKQHLSGVYGIGSIECTADELILDGWQRTWLGSAIQAQVAYARRCIRNVARDGERVSIEVKRKYRPVRRIAFVAASASEAKLLVARLPTDVSPGFERKWTEIQDFNTRLRSVTQRPFVTAVIIAINVSIFLAMFAVTKQWSAFAPQTLIDWGANFGPLTVNGQWWRLLTAVFVHFNLPHLLFNMWALWNMGRLCERLFGRLLLAFLYLASGVLASLSSVVWNPALSSVGASGAIFGVFGAFLAFYLKPANRVPAAIARRHWLSISAFILFNLISGALQPGIDNAAHVGGLLAGFALGWILASPLELGGRSPLRFGQYSGSVALVAAVAAAAIWQVKGIGSEMTAPERFLRGHAAYLNGEAKNLKLWSELAARAAAGSISDLELGERFEREILPFWKDAHAQLDKENETLQGPQRKYSLLFGDYVKLRYEWAQKIIEAMNARDPQLAAEAQSFVQKTSLAQARLERLWIRAQMDHRPRALANNPIIARSRNWLTGSRWRCVEAPVDRFPIPAAADNLHDGPAARHAVGCLAQRLLMAGDYGGLDSLMNRYASALADLPDGSSHYEGVVSGLDSLFDYGGLDSPELLGRMSDWRRSVNNSWRPDLLEALIFQSSAWSVRGHGGADSVSPQGWAAFAYRTEMAAESLRDVRANAESDPAWYQASLSVGLDQGLAVDRLRSIFDDGAGRFPAYFPIERAMLRILMPRWRGSYAEVDRFINEISGKTTEQGFARYARLYSEYAELEGEDLDLFTDTPALWDQMKVGYGDLMKRYPESDRLLNQFAFFACRAGDGDRYRTLRNSLDKRYSSVVWRGTYSLAFCDGVFGFGASKSASAPATSPAAKAARAAAVRHEAPDSPMESRLVPILSLGGIRLGMTPKELLDAKGTPLSRRDKNWSYKSVVSRRNGVLTVVFKASANASDERIVAIEYSGDEKSSPPEIPYLNGLDENDLHSHFGHLIGMGSPSEDVTTLRFRNGVYADVRSGRVFRYGIYTAELPH